jgi:hypothetical protein
MCAPDADARGCGRSIESVTGYAGRNRACLERLRAVAVRPAYDLQLGLAEGWTIAATLAHIAHWDGWVEARWGLVRRWHRFEDIPDWHLDLANAAGLPIWSAMPAETAGPIAVAAAESVLRVIDGLTPSEVQLALDSGRMAMLDRTIHWRTHLDKIERALA